MAAGSNSRVVSAFSSIDSMAGSDLVPVGNRRDTAVASPRWPSCSSEGADAMPEFHPSGAF